MWSCSTGLFHSLVSFPTLPLQFSPPETQRDRVGHLFRPWPNHRFALAATAHVRLRGGHAQDFPILKPFYFARRLPSISDRRVHRQVSPVRKPSHNLIPHLTPSPKPSSDIHPSRLPPRSEAATFGSIPGRRTRARGLYNNTTRCHRRPATPFLPSRPFRHGGHLFPVSAAAPRSRASSAGRLRQ